MSQKKERGRPELYGEPTVLFARRVPASKLAMIGQVVDPILKSLEVKKDK